MAFAGTDLARAGIEGPFRVHASLSLGLLPLTYAGLGRPEPIPSGDWIEWNYTTRASEPRDFTAPVRAAFITGRHADASVDVASDCHADSLLLTPGAHVTAAGPYKM